MQRLNGVDAAFLYMETPTMHMHIVGVILLDPSTVEGGYSFEQFKLMVRSKLHRLPPFYRRLRRVPLNLEHPYWVVDGDFDIDYHVRRTTIAAPGDRAELGKLVGQIAAKQLDRDRPLWELWVVEGLEDGKVAIVTKMHHAAADGMASGYLMLQLLDFSADPPPIGEPEPLPSEEDDVPDDVGMLMRAVRDRVSDPVRLYRQARKSVTRASELLTMAVKKGTENFRPVLPFMAPRTMFNRAISSERIVAFGAAPLDDFKVVKRAYNCTVNDVVLAACTGALREYLIAHDDLPDRALMASCPVSVRTAQQTDDYGNRVSTLFVRLPVHIEDPVEQLKVVTLDTRDAKTVHKAMGAEMLQDWAELAAPYAFTAAARMYSRMKLANKHHPVHNLIVSNVPGPPFDLYCMGAKVEEFYPLGPVLEGAGINITCVSHKGDMDIGIMACPQSAPNPQVICDRFADAVAALRVRAEAKLEALNAS